MLLEQEDADLAKRDPCWRLCAGMLMSQNYLSFGMENHRHRHSRLPQQAALPFALPRRYGGVVGALGVIS